MSSTEKKFKAFALVTYAEPSQVTEILEEKFNEGTLTAYAHILHDKDSIENENGERVRKQPHTHIVLTASSHRTSTSVKNWFKAVTDFKGELANTMVQATHTCIRKDGRRVQEPIDVQGATFYLVHEDKEGKPLPNKHHYDWSEVVSQNLEMLKNPPEIENGRPQKEDKTFEILQELMNGENPYILAQKYGRDFILNYRKFCEVAQACAKFGEIERIQREVQEKDYAEYSRGIYVLMEDGTIEETDIALRNQNARLKETNTKLLRSISGMRQKFEVCKSVLEKNLDLDFEDFYQTEYGYNKE